MKFDGLPQAQHHLTIHILNLNLKDARVIFRRNASMLQTVRYNFKSNLRYKAENYLCPDCLHLDPQVKHADTQEQLLSCRGNLDLRHGKILGELKDEAVYYREIIQRSVQMYGA